MTKNDNDLKFKKLSIDQLKNLKKKLRKQIKKIDNNKIELKKEIAKTNQKVDKLDQKVDKGNAAIHALMDSYTIDLLTYHRYHRQCKNFTN